MAMKHQNLKSLSVGEVQVNYLHRPAKRDTRHLIVIFSGYRARGTFDFQGRSTEDLNCSVLWIEDWFDENHCYYIRTKRHGYLVAEAIQKLIAEILKSEGLTKADCTLSGFSKGGSGALYHGLKYDFQNIISAVPRMNIGTANQKRHPRVFQNMVDSQADSSVKELDDAIPSLLSNDLNNSRNIYLFSSPADYQYQTEIEPFLPLFAKYDNFNFIRTDSPFVREHKNVTAYNVGIINSIMRLCSEGMPPRFSTLQGVGDYSRKRARQSVPLPLRKGDSEFSELNVDVSRIIFDKDQLVFKGTAVRLGFGPVHAKKCQALLVIRNEHDRKEYPTVRISDKSLSSKYFRRVYIDYSNFAFQGEVDCSQLETLVPGIYDVGVRSKISIFDEDLFSLNSKVTDSKALINNRIYLLRNSGESMKLHVLDMSCEYAMTRYFELTDFYYKNGKIHVDGIFALAGHDYSHWSSVDYYISFVREGSNEVVWSSPLAKDQIRHKWNAFSDNLNDYGKARFATAGYKGISVPDEIRGKFNIRISQLKDTVVQTVDSGLILDSESGLLGFVS